MSQTRTNAAHHHTRRWIPYAGAVLLVALIVAGLWPKPVPVEITRASVGALRATVNEEGKTRIKQRYVVSAPVAGQLRRIPFKAGAEIKAGDIVAVVEPVSASLLDARTRSTAEAKKDTAMANREKARAASTLAASELRRAEKLYADTTISIQELETFKMRADSTANELAAAEGTLRQAEAELAEFLPGGDSTLAAKDPPLEIKAPVSGRVLRVFEENARAVPAGTELLEIGDPADLEVVVEVLSRDGAMIAPGAPVEFDQWGGGEPLWGKVRLVEPAAFTKVSALGVEEQRVNVIADLVTPPEQRRSVGDKFRVDARIVVWEAPDILKVPVGALFRQGDQWATFVVTEGRARLRLVKAGRSSGTETQVLEGLKEGEEVILYPGSRVHDGQRVRPIKI